MYTKIITQLFSKLASSSDTRLPRDLETHKILIPQATLSSVYNKEIRSYEKLEHNTVLRIGEQATGSTINPSNPREPGTS